MIEISIFGYYLGVDYKIVCKAFILSFLLDITIININPHDFIF